MMYLRWLLRRRLRRHGIVSLDVKQMSPIPDLKDKHIVLQGKVLLDGKEKYWSVILTSLGGIRAMNRFVGDVAEQLCWCRVTFSPR